MTLIEALATGLRIRRPILKHVGVSRSGWLGNQFIKEYLTCSSGWRDHFKSNIIDEVDLFAKDWEVEHGNV